MNNLVKCPSCSTEFDNSAAVELEIQARVKAESAKQLSTAKAELEQSLKLAEKARQEFESKQSNLSAEIEEKAKILSLEKQAQIKANIEKENEQLVQGLADQLTEKSEKIKKLTSIEIEYSKLKFELLEKDAEFSLLLEKEKGRIIEEQSAKMQQAAKEIANSQNLELTMSLKEAQLKNEQLTKRIDELSQNANQGSMQAQGEVGELVIEDKLREWFKMDELNPIPKGVSGPDCIQIVRNSNYIECGSIIYESKRTKSWSEAWIKKLRDDSSKLQIPYRVIVSEAMPSDQPYGGYRDGVWVTSFANLQYFAVMIRQLVIKVFEDTIKESNKADKMSQLYEYLNSEEFTTVSENIVRGFVDVKQGIEKERLQMEKLWKEREKTMQMALISMHQFVGSVRGISQELLNYDLPAIDESKRIKGK